MLDGVVMAMILVITVITQDWHKLDEDKFDADGAADNKELEATQDTRYQIQRLNAIQSKSPA